MPPLHMYHVDSGPKKAVCLSRVCLSQVWVLLENSYPSGIRSYPPEDCSKPPYISSHGFEVDLSTILGGLSVQKQGDESDWSCAI